MTATWLRPSVGRSADEVATVSVVVPCYNYARFVREAVTSALAQDGVDVEVVVVDDASTDESLAVVQKLAVADHRVRVVAHQTNQGPVVTFNDGLEVAAGEFLVRLDADDVLTPGSLRRAVDVCRAHPRVGLVYGRARHFSGTMPTPRLAATYWRVWDGDDWLAQRCIDAYNVITSPEAFMRMSVVRQVGGQRPLAHTHDMEMWLRIAAFSDVAYVRGADQAWHREHDGSLSARHVDTVRDLEERLAAFRELAAGIAADRPSVQKHVPRAMAAIARQATGFALIEAERGGAGSQLITTYTNIAVDADPGIAATREWAQLQRCVDGERPGKGTVVGKALLRRLEWRRRRRRWERTGAWT